MCLPPFLAFVCRRTHSQTLCLAFLLGASAFARAQEPITEPATIKPATPITTPTATATPPVTPTPTPTIAPIPTPTPTRAPTPTGVNPQSSESLQTLARRLRLPLPLPNARVVVWKSQRKLELWSGQTLVKTYRVALGANPIGGKAARGDHRTPEGRFYICFRNGTSSAFHRFMGLSYPALPDVQRGLKTQQLTAREYMLMTRQLSARGVPLWRTKLGGWVGIHGGNDGVFARKRRQERGVADWTAGCIALSNHESEELFAATRLGTPVDVRP